MRACTICNHQLADDSDRYACRSCEHSLRYFLTALAGEMPLLQACLIPGGTRLTGSRFGGRADAPVPLDLRVLNLLGPGTAPEDGGQDVADVPLVARLRAWARRLAAAFPSRTTRYGTEYIEPYGGCDGAVNRAGADAAAWCGWLTAYLPYAVDLALVAELHRDLDQALRTVRSITGTRPRTHVRLAPCPDCGGCAMTRTDGRWEITCQACGYEMEPDEYDAHAAAVLPGLARTMARIVSTNAQLNQAS